MNEKFGKVTRSTLADGIGDRILGLIRAGEYEPGDRLPAITEMARSFGVGHPTVREALKKLQIVGVIDIRHGSGVYVKGGLDTMVVSNPVFTGTVSKKLLLDLIEARMPLEITAAGLAATGATEAHLERMERFLAQAHDNLDDDDVLTSFNMAFHREIAAASDNTVLAQIQDVLTNLFRREQSMILSIYILREKDHEEHLQILDALRRRDPELARQRMQAHLEGVRDVLREWDPEKMPVI
jgi:GntR family transcriptional regulator, transcriptional repressor for pyruvate dehydrogenase complex